MVGSVKSDAKKSPMAFPSGGCADWVAGFAAGPIRGGSYDNAARLLEGAWRGSAAVRARRCPSRSQLSGQPTLEASTWPSLTVAGAFPLPDHGLCANLTAVFGDYVTLQAPIGAPPVGNESETIVHNIDHLVFACLLYWKNAFLYFTSNLVVAIRWKIFVYTQQDSPSTSRASQDIWQNSTCTNTLNLIHNKKKSDSADQFLTDLSLIDLS